MCASACVCVCWRMYGVVASMIEAEGGGKGGREGKREGPRGREAGGGGEGALCCVQCASSAESGTARFEAGAASWRTRSGATVALGFRLSSVGTITRRITYQTQDAKIRALAYTSSQDSGFRSHLVLLCHIGVTCTGNKRSRHCRSSKGRTRCEAFGFDFCCHPLV